MSDEEREKIEAGSEAEPVGVETAAAESAAAEAGPAAVEMGTEAEMGAGSEFQSLPNSVPVPISESPEPSPESSESSAKSELVAAPPCVPSSEPSPSVRPERSDPSTGSGERVEGWTDGVQSESVVELAPAPVRPEPVEGPAVDASPSPASPTEEFAFSHGPSLRSRIEALLFAAPAPLKLLDLAQLLESSRPVVKRALDELMAEWASRDSALAIARQGPGYAIVLRNEYQDFAALLMPPELEPAAMKTLSVLAVNQPIPQSRLVELRGGTAYEHVKALVEKGLVKRRKDGSTFVLRTTKLFATRFRVEDDPERIREALLALERKPLAPVEGDITIAAEAASDVAPETPAESV